MKNKIFPYVDFSSNANGGTEIQRDFLLKYVDNSILEKFEIILSYPSIDFMKGDKPVILWLHDLPEKYFDVLYNKQYQNQFDFFVFVSYWQRGEFIRKYNLTSSKCFVIQNAIEPLSGYNLTRKWNDIEKIKICYTSLPHKGLRLAFEVYNEIYNTFGEQVEFNVFSNYKTYGDAHLSRNEPYKALYNKLIGHEGVNYTESLPHEELLTELKQQHIWFHPSTFPETSCISLMEAASAKCILVHSDLGALPETSSNFGEMFKADSDINIYAGYAYNALASYIDTIKKHREEVTGYLDMQKGYFDFHFSWILRKAEWEGFLKHIIT